MRKWIYIFALVFCCLVGKYKTAHKKAALGVRAESRHHRRLCRRTCLRAIAFETRGMAARITVEGQLPVSCFIGCWPWGREHRRMCSVVSGAASVTDACVQSPPLLPEATAFRMQHLGRSLCDHCPEVSELLFCVNTRTNGFL